jgi:hypothetical protein
LAIVCASRSADFARSMRQSYQKSGRMPPC